MNSHSKIIELCENENIEELKKILITNKEFINGDKEHPEWLPPLYYSLIYNKINSINCLLDFGADINECLGVTRNEIYGEDDRVFTNEPIISCLISYLYDTSGDETEEEYQVRLEDVSLFNLLIQKGVDLNKTNNQGYTPLDIALIIGYKQVEDLLKKNGAKHGKRFFENDAKYNYSEKELKNLDYLDIPYINKTPPILHKEISKTYNEYKLGYDELKKGFIGGYSDEKTINQKDWKGRTPLDFAEEIGHHVAVEYLLSVGAKRSSEL